MTQSNIEFLYEELRKATDGGSESMTHDDALKQIAYWRDLTERDRKSYQAGHNEGVAHHKKAIAAARVADQREIEALKARIEVDFKRWQEAIANYDFERSLNQKLMDGSAKLTANNETLKSEVAAARVQALEEAALVAGGLYQHYRDLYKGRATPVDEEHWYNPHTDGVADGAGMAEDAIRALIETNLTTGETK